MAAHVNGGGEGMLNTGHPREAPRRPTGESGGRNHARPTEKHAAPARAPSEPTVADMVWTLIERRWTVVAVTAAVLAFAAVYLFVTPPMYEASILIQVEGRSRPVTAFQDLATLFQEPTPTEGEMRILKSRTLLDAVVEQLGLDVVVRPRTLPFVGNAFAARYAGPAPAPARFGLGRFAWGGERIRVERLTVSDVLLGEPLVLTALEGGRYRIAASDGGVLAEGEVGKTVIGTDGERSIELLVSDSPPGRRPSLRRRKGAASPSSRGFSRLFGSRSRAGPRVSSRSPWPVTTRRASRRSSTRSPRPTGARASKGPPPRRRRCSRSWRRSSRC